MASDAVTLHRRALRIEWFTVSWNVVEAGVRVAEDVGLDFFGFGEHHTRSMPTPSTASMSGSSWLPTGAQRVRHTLGGQLNPTVTEGQNGPAAGPAPGREDLAA